MVKLIIPLYIMVRAGAGESFSKSCFHPSRGGGKACLQGVSGGVGPVWSLHLPFTLPLAGSKLAQNCLNLAPTSTLSDGVKAM